MQKPKKGKFMDMVVDKIGGITKPTMPSGITRSKPTIPGGVTRSKPTIPGGGIRPLINKMRKKKKGMK